MFRSACLGLLLSALVCCDSPADKDGGGTSASSATQPLDIVVRAVELQQTIKTPPVEKGGEEEEWKADANKVYAVVTAEIAHNQCAAGDKIDAGQATLVLDGGTTAKAMGGGAKAEALCVQCEPKEALDCNTAARLRPFLFIFEVDAKSDLTKAVLRYRSRDAALASAKMSDKRGNDPLDAQIDEKKARLAEMRKRLENTSSTVDGKVMLGEMEALQKEIDALEKQRK